MMIRPKVQRTPWHAIPSPPETNTFERCAIWVPGYDCRVVCEHTPPQKSNHGQHGDEIHAVLRSRILQEGLCTPLEFATSLAIFTHVRAGAVADGFVNLTEPASVSLHASHGGEYGPGPCEYLWSGTCHNTQYSGLQAKEIWDKYTEIDFHPEVLIAGSCAERLLEVERLWERLIAWHHAAVLDFLKNRVDDART